MAHKEKKSSKSKVSRANYMKEVVEYKKKTGKKEEEKKDDKTHIKNA